MSKIGQTIRGYIWWTHRRGSFHYDVMVSIILLFIFLAPIWVNFNDKPARQMPHQTEVVVVPNGPNRFIYEVSAGVVNPADEVSTRESLMAVIEPIAGESSIERYEVRRDGDGKAQMYKVWVTK